MIFTKIVISSIGKTPSEYRQVEQHYLKLIKTKIILSPYNGLSHLDPEEQIKKESSLLLQKTSDADFIISLDPRGRNMTSVEFAKTISSSGRSKIIHFIIGGSYGLSDQARSCSNIILSLSDLTMPHQLAKIILLEQIYRAESIISGGRYNK